MRQQEHAANEAEDIELVGQIEILMKRHARFPACPIPASCFKRQSV
jgi:hypothetical protein